MKYITLYCKKEKKKHFRSFITYKLIGSHRDVGLLNSAPILCLIPFLGQPFSLTLDFGPPHSALFESS